MKLRHAELVYPRGFVLAWLWLASCSADSTQASGNRAVPTLISPAGGAGSGSSTMAPSQPAAGSPNPSQVGSAGQAAAPPKLPTAGTPATAVPPPTPPANPTVPIAGSAGSAGGAAAAPPGNMPKPTGDPEDGDASKPIVTNPDMACRQTTGGGFGINQPNFKIDDRDVIIDYPCNKHEGAPMTFILNLHGTTPVAQHFYQEGYFSAWQFVASHNLIIATPSSVVQQWGNGDNGQDAPYLMDVIAYMYKAFGKFDIKQMWVGGHSWGAFYTSQFGCKSELADKVKGLIIMSGASTLPSCSSKMSLLNTVAEMDIGPAIDFQSLPMQHGCGAAASAMLGNNQETFWPGCSAPFVHAKYTMLGKMHADFMDKEVVQSLVDWIKISRQMQH
jgi:hypothetical protein